MDFMGVNGYTKCSLGIKKKRKYGWQDLDVKSKNKLVRVFGHIIWKAAHAFLLDEPEFFVRESLKYQGVAPFNCEDLKRWLMACNKRINQKRLVRAIIAGCIGGRVGMELMARDVHYGGMKWMKNTITTSSGSEEDMSQEDEEGKVNGIASSRAHKWSGYFRVLRKRSLEDWKH